MVETWLTNPSTNYGVLLKATNEDLDGCDIRIASSENSVAPPYLEVCYTREIEKKYYLKDHLGNIRVTVDESGVVKANDDYGEATPSGLSLWTVEVLI
jgi:hypothetical protein